MQKYALLKLLETFNSTRTHPLWITGSDFNMITQLEEKKEAEGSWTVKATTSKNTLKIIG